MKITYTKHAILYKFPKLKELGFAITKQTVSHVVRNPDYLDLISDYPKSIASKSLDDKHILRVVYRQENDRMLVITFYPCRKDRYYAKNKNPL